jgi:hypothetical protein
LSIRISSTTGIAIGFRRWRARHCAYSSSETEYRASWSRAASAAWRPASIASGIRHVAEVGLQQHVGLLQPLDLARLGFLHRKRRDLTGDSHRRAEILGLRDRRRDVHRDHRFGAEVLRDVDRQVVRDVAIHEHAVVDDHGRERRGHRHARALRHRERAAIEHHGLARRDVGRDRAERQRQVLDLREAVLVERHRAQEEVELLALDEARRDEQAPVLETEPQIGEEVPVVLLAPEREVLAIGLVLEHAHPVDALDRLVDLGGREPRGIESADHRAHARSGHDIDGDPHLFEHLEHAEVRGAARAAAREHESHLRPRCGLLPLLRLLLRSESGRNQEQRRAEQRGDEAGKALLGHHQDIGRHRGIRGKDQSKGE